MLPGAGFRDLSETAPHDLNGACLCGAVTYVIPDALRYAGYCHCQDCRRFSGSIFSAYGGVPAEDMRITAGDAEIRRFAKSDETIMVFCQNCGSSLFAEKPAIGMVHVRLGTLTDLPSLAPQVHAYVGSKVPWFEITDGLPEYALGSTLGGTVP